MTHKLKTIEAEGTYDLCTNLDHWVNNFLTSEPDIEIKNVTTTLTTLRDGTLKMFYHIIYTNNYAK